MAQTGGTSNLSPVWDWINAHTWPTSIASQTTLADVERDAEYSETHVHTIVRWYTKKNPQGVNEWCTPLAGHLAQFWRCISGNGTWGADANDEALLFGTDDLLTELGTGLTYGDMDKILFLANSSTTPYIVRIIWGTGTMAAAVTANQYTEIAFLRAVADTNRKVYELKMPKVGVVGYKLWAQCQNATNNATIDFILGVHAYNF